MYDQLVATYLCSDAIFRRHQPSEPHAEAPDRLQAIEDRLAAAGLLSRCQRIAARAATRDELLRVHTADYLDRIDRLLGPANSAGWLDPDTYYSAGSHAAALHAAGATIDLALQVLSSAADNGMVLCRPPGHHAPPDRAMGFCIFNNIAVAAAAARAQGARVAIVDIDVHHGNGTQDIFAADPNPLFISLHQWPLYPGTGPATFTGAGAGIGATLNLPLPAHSDDGVYDLCFHDIVLPALSRFQPDLVLVSAGFDAHLGDPLAGMMLSNDAYARMTAQLLSITPRVAAVLEGGYHRQALGESAAAMVATLLGAPAPALPAAGPGLRVPLEVRDRVGQLRRLHRL